MSELLTTVFAFLLVVGMIWGVPTFAIYYEKYIPLKEKKLWMVANIFFPWVTYLAFLLVAPITGAEES